MFKRILSLVLVTTISIMALAQGRHEGPKPGSKSEGRPSFEKFMQEKTDFIVREMQLPQAASAQFVDLYKEMQLEKGKTMQKFHDRRTAIHKARRGEQATDAEYLEAARAEVSLSVEDAMIDQKYLERFEKVLTPEQLFRYVQAEKKFKSQFMRGKRPGGGGNPPEHERGVGPSPR